MAIICIYHTKKSLEWKFFNPLLSLFGKEIVAGADRNDDKQIERKRAKKVLLCSLTFHLLCDGDAKGNFRKVSDF